MLAAAAGADGALQAIHQQAPVGQTGERIMKGQVRYGVVHGLALGNVAGNGDQAGFVGGCGGFADDGQFKPAGVAVQLQAVLAAV